ncbi:MULTISPECIES: molybdenum ABC transporter ATP-binding protein [unclassified Sphingopyxis]|jgi:molybdate transport system ATP-binding protein|uniref:molybdenum ABC transporter ATP-binding protein n=1 Tax=unclassified Sphingopyxis TaxID=2614943 RepID=UPI0006C09BAB|nr:MULTISPECIES: ATP-binding cassette domain-containing protein [unclassified Sphingopyxis]USI76217.1 ATP-binding cassette domain-containing protein [Sphingopyxis sp. USTB-05]GAO77076.1 molybdenum transport ATP-binding protein ModC [Sphingopyxis sp. C-1]
MAIDIDVEKRRGDRIIAARFNAGAGLTALFGPSGAGKTSILNMVAGLLKPDRGHIRIGDRTLFGDGVDLPPEARRIGYVFQDGRLFPHRRVRANLLYGHDLVDPTDRWMSLGEAVRFLGIADLLDRWPHTLSGGEMQRVAIGRALLAAPEILLMDEPLSSLDAARRSEIMTVIERIRDELKLPILYVSHDRAEVDRLATSVVAIGE